MTSLQRGTMAGWLSTKHLHGQEQKIDSCWRQPAAGDEVSACQSGMHLGLGNFRDDLSVSGLGLLP